METVNPEPQSAKDKKPKKVPPSEKPKEGLKKLSAESLKCLENLRTKANSKTYGRRIRDSEIIAKALTLMTPDHLKQLQESTIRGKDRLMMAYEEHKKQHGKIGFDEFIEKLTRTDIDAAKTTKPI